MMGPTTSDDHSSRNIDFLRGLAIQLETILDSFYLSARRIPLSRSLRECPFRSAIVKNPAPVLLL